MIVKNKLFFRFFFILSCLLVFPFPLNISQEITWPGDAVTAVYHKIIPWIGKNVLNLQNEIPTTFTGSGDTTYDYILLLFFAFLAFLAAIIWTTISKKEIRHEKLNRILEIILSYYLGVTMIQYGLYKVIPLQFPEPYFYKLLQPYGESSPMGLAWTFMGASKGYVIFSGLAETIGGLLLFHRKTRLLAALFLIPVLVNVVAINFFYDVPVKLFSIQLLVFAILIAMPDVKRLVNVVVLNRPIPAKESRRPFLNGRWKRVLPKLKWIVIIAIFSFTFYDVYNAKKTYGPDATKPELYGLYEVSNFIINKDTLLPMYRDTIGWRYITFEWEESMQIHRNDMKRIGHESKIDTLTREISLKSFQDSTNIFTLNYTKRDSTIIFSGIMKNDTIYCETKRLDKSDFLLMNRGFHWINETPYNR